MDYPAGVLPVGSVTFWLGSYANVPTLPSEYVQCNGQVISDPQSVFNGVTLPNLNGASSGVNRFLRGAKSGGTVAGSMVTNETHTHTGDSAVNGLSGSTTVFAGTVVGSASSLSYYYGVIWIARIK